jgi:hypothetical protein
VAFYYQKHMPRRDLFTNELIQFKSKEYYFNTDFNTKGNLKKWLEKSSPSEQREYITQYFLKRKQNKNLVYTPCQNELKTLPIPGMVYLNKLFGDYYQWADSLGFINKYRAYSLDKSLITDISNKVIFADKREQKRLDFNLTTRNKSMSFGDYRMANRDIYIERKSVADLWGTLTIGYERFIREIERAKAANCYLVTVVEEALSEVYKYPHRWQVRHKIKMSAEIPLHNMRAICQNYSHTQFVFVKDRETASKTIEKIFSIGDQYKWADLQYLLDIGEL